MCSIQSSFVPLMDFYSLSTYALPNLKNVPSFLRLPSPKACNHHSRLRAVLPIEEIPPNALRRKNDPQWRGGFSLGVDLGLSRTGLALSKGFSVRPLMVISFVFSPFLLSFMWNSRFNLICIVFRFWSCEGKSLSLGFLKLLKMRLKFLPYTHKRKVTLLFHWFA